MQKFVEILLLEAAKPIDQEYFRDRKSISSFSSCEKISTAQSFECMLLRTFISLNIEIVDQLEIQYSRASRSLVDYKKVPTSQKTLH